MTANGARPPGGRGWPPVIAHACVAGITQVFWLTYSPISTDAAVHYGVSTGSITWLANVYPVLYFVLAIPAGRLLDRWPRNTLMIGAILVGVGGVLRIVADSYGAALAGQVLISIAQPVLLNGLIVVAHANLAPDERAAGIALGSAGFFVGILVGFTSPVLLASGPDIQTLLVAQAIVGVLGAAWMVWSVRAMRAPVLTSDVDSAVLRRVIRDPGVRVLAVLMFGGFGVFGAVLGVLQPLLAPRGVSTDTADLIVVGMVLAGLVTAAFAPAWAARTGHEATLLIGGLTVGAIAMGLAAFHLPLVWLALVLAGAGALLVPALPVLLDLAEHLLPDAGGTVAAVLWLAGNLGAAVLTGLGQALLGSPSVAFLAFAVAGGATALYGARRLRLVTVPAPS